MFHVFRYFLLSLELAISSEKDCNLFAVNDSRFEAVFCLFKNKQDCNLFAVNDSRYEAAFCLFKNKPDCNLFAVNDSRYEATTCLIDSMCFMVDKDPGCDLVWINRLYI